MRPLAGIQLEQLPVSSWNLTMSSSVNCTLASIPSPDTVLSVKFLKVKLGEPAHIGFPHPKSASYIGSPHKLVKVKRTTSPLATLWTCSPTEPNMPPSWSVFTYSLSTLFIDSLIWLARLQPSPADGTVLAAQEMFPKEYSDCGGHMIDRRFM